MPGKDQNQQRCSPSLCTDTLWLLAANPLVHTTVQVLTNRSQIYISTFKKGSVISSETWALQFVARLTETGVNRASEGDYFHLRINTHFVHNWVFKAPGWFMWDWLSLLQWKKASQRNKMYQAVATQAILVNRTNLSFALFVNNKMITAFVCVEWKLEYFQCCRALIMHLFIYQTRFNSLFLRLSDKQSLSLPPSLFSSIWGRVRWACVLVAQQQGLQRVLSRENVQRKCEIHRCCVDLLWRTFILHICSCFSVW